MQIDRDDLRSPEVVAFLQEHVTQLRDVTPPGSSHALDLVGLRAPDVRFWTATGDDGELLGCAALKALTSEHAELKSMRTAGHRTRQGVATTLLRHVLDEARAAGFARVSLETGSFDFFAPGPGALRPPRVRRVRTVRRLPPRPAQHVHDARAAPVRPA